jgi:hypothetical protein
MPKLANRALGATVSLETLLGKVHTSYKQLQTQWRLLVPCAKVENVFMKK